ncbi:MAG: aminomethyl-transferring glycine dehydrogenase subunit GcvPB, partial [Pseudomonadota bacterium]
CDSLLSLARAAKAGDNERFASAPQLAPKKRLDETQAARKPVLRWTPPLDTAALAAE